MIEKLKGHYLIRYPIQIMNCGPSIDHGAIHYFESVYNRSNNCKNVTKSLATHHQFMMYLHYKKEFTFDHEKITTVFNRRLSLCLSINNIYIRFG